MKRIMLTGLVSVFLLTACKKDDQIAEKSLEQQKIEFQMRQLEIEKQKLAIEKERMAYETQKKADSIAEVQKAKTAAAAASTPKVIRETRTVYRDRNYNSGSNGSYANNGSSASQGTTQKRVRLLKERLSVQWVVQQREPLLAERTGVLVLSLVGLLVVLPVIPSVDHRIEKTEG